MLRKILIIVISGVFMGGIAFAQTVYQVEAGVDDLHLMVESAQEGDIFELVTSGGIYETAMNKRTNINVPLTIRAAEGLAAKPVLINTYAGATYILHMRQGGSLTLEGVELDGQDQVNYFLRVQPDAGHFYLRVKECYVHNFVHYFYNQPEKSPTEPGFCDELIFENCVFEDNYGGIRACSDMTKLQNNYVGLFNCTFYNIKRNALKIYGGDEDPSTQGPVVEINHCTFEKCGVDTMTIINSSQVDNMEIKNSVFSNGFVADTLYAALLYGGESSISYSDLWQVPNIYLERGATQGAGMLSVDPQFADHIASQHLTLTDGSPLIGQADDGLNVGVDLNYLPETSVKRETIAELPNEFRLDQNYPNPFNSTTTIIYSLKKAGDVKLTVFDVLGKRVRTLVSGKQTAGVYKVEWDGTIIAMGKSVANGIYFYKLEMENQKTTRKMMLLK